MSTKYPTLLKPPPDNPKLSPIESILEVTPLDALGPNIFTNARPPWLPHGNRGIFGGAVIGLCLATAQRTVAPNFVVHSCHCYFILAGSADLPILLYVEPVRDGRSFATRTVQARQKGQCIFTTTISFVILQDDPSLPPPSSSTPTPKPRRPILQHSTPLPDGTPSPPSPTNPGDPPSLVGAGYAVAQNLLLDVVASLPPSSLSSPPPPSPYPAPLAPLAPPHARKSRMWFRARGPIAGGLPAHLNALAYISDSFFIGTVARVHGLWRLPVARGEMEGLDAGARARVLGLRDWGGLGLWGCRRQGDEEGGERAGGEGQGCEEKGHSARPKVGMAVSLDHTIYFHEPRDVKADEWMFTEMESPWAGHERGLVTQRIFAQDGTLLATCVQEGVVRMEDPDLGSKKTAKL